MSRSEVANNVFTILYHRISMREGHKAVGGQQQNGRPKQRGMKHV